MSLGTSELLFVHILLLGIKLNSSLAIYSLQESADNVSPDSVSPSKDDLLEEACKKYDEATHLCPSLYDVCINKILDLLVLFLIYVFENPTRWLSQHQGNARGILYIA